MKHKTATDEQIKLIKKLHYLTGNIRASMRPYKKMRYTSAIKEIDMLNKKLAATKWGDTKVDPLGSYSWQQIRELAIIGDAFLRGKLLDESVDVQLNELVDQFQNTDLAKESTITKKSRTILRKKGAKNKGKC